MASVELNCPWAECEYVTPSLEASIAMQMLHMHQTARHPTITPAKQEKAKLPMLEVIDGVVTEAALGVYKQRLVSYKRLAGLCTDAPDTVLQGLPISAYNQLYARYGETLVNQTEAMILSNIATLMVRPENKLSHVLKLQSMRQDDQTVVTFSTNLRAAARKCNFQVKCECDRQVSYENDMILYQLLSGLSDSSVQADLLAKSELTLTDAEQYATDREMAKRSQASIAPEELGRMRSTYRREKQRPVVHPPQQCTYCGEAPHSNRARECRAFNNICACGLKGHLTKCCRRNGKPRHASSTNERHKLIKEDTLLELSSKFVITDTRESILGLKYDATTGSWAHRDTTKDKCLPVTISVDKDSYLKLHRDRRDICFRPASHLAIADTGATVTCGGPQILASLSMQLQDLVPAQIKLFAASKTPLTVLGCIPVHVTWSDQTNSADAIEMLYIVKELDGVYLSKDSLIALGSISQTFPVPSPSRTNQNICVVGGSSHANNSRAPCGCLLRTSTPDPPVPPEDMSESNIPELQELIVQHYASSTFNTCCHQPLPMMHGPPLELALKPDVQPTAVYTPAVVPLHWRERIKADLDRDVDMGVLEKVDVNEPVSWCSRMVITRKHNGEPRRTIDLQALNEASIRQTHPTMPPFQQAMSIPSHCWKTTTDAFNGYHSVLLRESDRPLTTFLTPWGRYRYKTTPQGYKVSGDAYTHRFDKITVNVKDCARVIDDSILYKRTIKEMFVHVTEYLTLCGKNGILQNKDKFTFCKQTVDWAGCRIGPASVHPLPSHTESIRSFPTPKNRTDVRSFLALVNQVSPFYATQPKLLPFRALLSQSTPWYWDEVLDKLFVDTCELIAREVEKGIQSFDPTKRTCILTDWCKTGMGYVITQKHCSCAEIRPTCCVNGWEVCGVGSRFTSPAESRYSPTEGEALAVVNALDKSRYFTLGCDDLIVGTDHKPLLGIFNNKSLESIDNPRIRRLKEKTFGWSFSLIHVPGRLHGGPDALSRYGLQNSDQQTSSVAAVCDASVESLFLESEVINHMTALLSIQNNTEIEMDDEDLISSVSTSLQPVDWRSLAVASLSDPVLNPVMELLRDGVSCSPDTIDPKLRDLWRIRGDLIVSNGVLLYKGRAVVPSSLRRRVLDTLHSAHQGITGMQLRAEQSVFWPGMTTDIELTRQRCATCNKNAPSNPNMPPITPITPEYPFQHVAADYFDYNGRSYGVIVDRFSNWFQIWQAPTGSMSLIQVLTALCRDFGVPETLTSDGGPQFTSRSTTDFLQQHGIDHRLTSVAFPHANCRAEVAVKTAKRLIRDNVSSDGSLDQIRLTRALLQYRNTPDRATGLSPAELLLGRQLRDFLPGSKLAPPLRSFRNLRDTWRDVAHWREKALCRRASKDHERLSIHTKDLPPLSTGQSVMVQNQTGNNPLKWDKRGVIVEVLPHRQYKVMIDGSRRLTLRNRKFLRAFTPLIHHGEKHIPVAKPSTLSRQHVPGSSTVPPARSWSPLRKSFQEEWKTSTDPSTTDHLTP